MRGHRAISEDERRRILSMALNGARYREIAQAFDRPQGTINRLISDAIMAGLVPRRKAQENARTTLYYDDRLKSHG